MEVNETNWQQESKRLYVENAKLLNENVNLRVKFSELQVEKSQLDVTIAQMDIDRTIKEIAHARLDFDRTKYNTDHIDREISLPIKSRSKAYLYAQLAICAIVIITAIVLLAMGKQIAIVERH